MTNPESVEAVARRIKRASEMSAGIMRDAKRTGGWAGAENTAQAFDRLAKDAALILAATPREPASNDHTDLIARLRNGVPALGLHEDNSTELFDVEAANEVMCGAADALQALHVTASERSIPDLEGHTADAVRDALRVVCGEIVSFDESGQIARHIIKHIDGIVRAALRAQTPGGK